MRSQRRRPMSLHQLCPAPLLLLLLCPILSAHPTERRSIAHPANHSPLQETLEDFKDLQRTLSQSVMFVDERESAAEEPEPEISYEIHELSSAQHRVRHGRHRHSKKRGDSSASFPVMRVNANLQKTSSELAEEARLAAAATSYEAQRDRSYSGTLRQTKDDRGCPTQTDGDQLLMCPSKKRMGSHSYSVCIDINQLCDTKEDCPGGEDENKVNCLFYKTNILHYQKVVAAVVKLADHMILAEQKHHEL